VKKIEGLIKFQNNYNQQKRGGFFGCQYFSSVVIRLLTFSVFSVVLLGSLRGFILARQEISQLSSAIAMINQHQQSRAREAIPSQYADITREQDGLKIDTSDKHKTVVLNHSNERSQVFSINVDSDILKQKLSTVALVKYFGQTFDLNAKKYSKYDHLFQKYSEKYFDADTDWRWFKVQAFVESGMRSSVSSRVGAIGVMQVMPATFKDIKRVNRFFKNKSINEVEWNIAAGIFYNRLLFKALSRKAAPKKRLQLMFASYNAGMSRILRSVDEDLLESDYLLTVPDAFPRETREYLKKIDVLMTHYRGVSYSKSFDDLVKLKLPAKTEVSPRS
jgi:type II secretory pathway pseudopilin PulG